MSRIASWAITIAWTIERPSPRASPCPVQLTPPRWKGRRKRTMFSGSTIGPALPTEKNDVPIFRFGHRLDLALIHIVAYRAVQQVHHQAFNQARITRDLRRGQSRLHSYHRRSNSGRNADTTTSTIPDRSRWSGRSSPHSLRARVRSASIRRSRCSPEANTRLGHPASTNAVHTSSPCIQGRSRSSTRTS